MAQESAEKWAAEKEAMGSLPRLILGAAMLHVAGASRLEARIFAESALIDKESGRIFWEGGSASTLSASLMPKLSEFGLVHMKASILSILLLLTLVSRLLGMITIPKPIETTPRMIAATWTVAAFLFRRIPQVDNRVVSLLVILYLLEAYFCNTRNYLTNAIPSPDGVETFIESLREQEPLLSWTVRSFHYTRPWSLGGRCSSSSMFKRKVISGQSTGVYNYPQCLDKTLAGVWKRSMSTNGVAPFAKLALNKILMLGNENARRDYFNQQSAFVEAHQTSHEDEYTEFSTKIEIPGFRNRLLAVRRPEEGDKTSRYFRHQLFWFFTCLGLTVPYRMWFTRHCDMIRVSVVKETYCETPRSSWFPTRTAANALPTPTKEEEESYRDAMKQMNLYASGVEEDQPMDEATGNHKASPPLIVLPESIAVSPEAAQDMNETASAVIEVVQQQYVTTDEDTVDENDTTTPGETRREGGDSITTKTDQLAEDL